MYSAQTMMGALCLMVAGCDGSSNLESRFNYGRLEPFGESTPSVSPDGASIVFDSSDYGNGDICQLTLSDQKITRLTTSSEVEMHPLYSPDGKKIVFARQSKGYQHLWIMNPDGSQPLQATSGRVLDYPSSFSTTGDALLFTRSTFFGRALMPKRETCRISLTNGAHGFTRLGNYSCVAPNMSMMVSNAYDLEVGKEKVWLVTSNLTHFIGEGSSAMFSPDSKGIVLLVRKWDFTYDVVVSAGPSWKPTVVPFPRSYKFPPLFCRDGAAVIVRIPTSQRDGAGGVYITDIKTSKTEKVPVISGGTLN